MNYVLEQVPPPRPGLPRPRFSLYLSSQLQYGVIVVFHRQCAILLGKKSNSWVNYWQTGGKRCWDKCIGPWHWVISEELQSIVGQLVKQRTSQKIDLDEHGRWEQLFSILDICLHFVTQITPVSRCFTSCFLSDKLWTSLMPCPSCRRQKELKTLYLEWCTCRMPCPAPIHWYRCPDIQRENF